MSDSEEETWIEYLAHCAEIEQELFKGFKRWESKMSHESHESQYDAVFADFYCSKCGIKLSTFEATKPCEVVPKLPKKQPCECGSHVTGSPRHSDYCPLYTKEVK